MRRTLRQPPLCGRGQTTSHHQVRACGATVNCTVTGKRTWYHVVFPDQGMTVRVNPDARTPGGGTVRGHEATIAHKAARYLDTLPPRQLLPALQWAVGSGGCAESIRWAAGKLGVDVPQRALIPAAVYDSVRAAVGALEGKKVAA